jgi:hypothetical protein
METFSGFPFLKYKYLAIIIILGMKNKFSALQFHNMERKIRANKFQENKLHTSKTSMQYSLDQPCPTRRPWYIFLAPSFSTFNWADF